MKKYKICVYAICKNEEKNLKGWLENVQEADKIFVLDTGSTDSSIEILKQAKENVVFQTKKYQPFRFDEARNDSLNMVDEDCDICVCCDIDERFIKNWRKIIEKNWTADTKLLSYRYTWNFNSDGSEGTVFFISKIHSRHDFKWVHPVHEVLQYLKKEPCKKIQLPELKLFHYADNLKSRSSYLPLLELSIQEDPEDDRNMHYLGREYMFHKKYDEAINTLNRHLTLKSATWKDERAASYRFIGRCQLAKNNFNEAKISYLKAICEAPYLREAYIELAYLLYEQKEYYGVIYWIEEALKIQDHSLTYINEAFAWNATPYDLLSLAYYFIHQKEKALEYVKKALQLSPDNERIQKNKEIFEKMA